MYLVKILDILLDNLFWFKVILSKKYVNNVFGIPQTLTVSYMFGNLKTHQNNITLLLLFINQWYLVPNFILFILGAPSFNHV